MRRICAGTLLRPFRGIPVRGVLQRNKFQSSLSQRARSIATHAHAEHVAILSRLKSNIDTSSNDYLQNVQAMDAALVQLRQLHARLQEGGSSKAREKHLERGKMLPREYRCLCSNHTIPANRCLAVSLLCLMQIPSFSSSLLLPDINCMTMKCRLGA